MKEGKSYIGDEKNIKDYPKTHYGWVDRANESDNNEYWSNTLCGLEDHESPMSDRIEYVSCLKCLKKYNQNKQS